MLDPVFTRLYDYFTIQSCYKVWVPRIVDHDSRRRELAEAVWRVIRRDGVRHASVRAVATEAGWSAGTLRHYFTTQAELLRFAIELILERLPRRLSALLAEPAGDPYTTARRILEELLPLDDERHVEALVWLAFADQARLDPELATVREQAWDGTRYLCRVAVADLRRRPRPAELSQPLADPADETRAEQLHALVDGLTLQAISYPDRMPAERLRGALSDHLQALSPAPDG